MGPRAAVPRVRVRPGPVDAAAIPAWCGKTRPSGSWCCRGRRRRPAAARVWSPLEYACHVRDVFRLFDTRLHLMLDEDDPLFANWDQDETAVAERYSEQDPRSSPSSWSPPVTVAESFAAVDGAQWNVRAAAATAPGSRSSPSPATSSTTGCTTHGTSAPPDRTTPFLTALLPAQRARNSQNREEPRAADGAGRDDPAVRPNSRPLACRALSDAARIADCSLYGDDGARAAGALRIGETP